MAEPAKVPGIDMNYDQLAYLLGNLAKASMGGYKDSWQSMVGGLGAEMGSAGQFSKEQNKQKAEQAAFRKQLLQMIGLGPTAVQTPGPNPTTPPTSGAKIPGLTPEGEPGPTNATMKINADGTFTKTESGDLPKKSEQFSFRDVFPF